MKNDIAYVWGTRGEIYLQYNFKFVVSIVLVTYNRAERLKLSIQDILNQTFEDFELIICDDCSTDSTNEICQEFLAIDNRVKYYRHVSNLKMPANCNFGIKKSTYPYIAILHDGDRFHPELLQQWYAAIAENDSVGFVFNPVGITDAQENVVSHIFECDGFNEGVFNKDELLKKIYFRQAQFYSPVYGQVMLKKKLVEDYGLLKKQYGFYADVDLWMHILHTHDAYFCKDTLITSPVKEIQPRLFDDNLIKTFLYMFTMQLVHRKKAFKNEPLILILELMHCWTLAFFGLNYRLLLIVKNFSFQSFIETNRLLKKKVLLLVPWTVILLLYPIIYPFLKLCEWGKIFLFARWRRLG